LISEPTPYLVNYTSGIHAIKIWPFTGIFKLKPLNCLGLLALKQLLTECQTAA